MNFDRHVASAAAFLDEIAEELGLPDDRERAGRILRVVCHTLRDRLTPTESFGVLSQLPLFVKGLYVEGWPMRSTPDRKIRTPGDFIAEMRRHDFGAAREDFPTDEAANLAARAVFRVLQRHLGERAATVTRELPDPLKQFWSAA